ncbi:MAG: cupin domain-containing protein [bacterium]|nr:cupin domain-containing protein [bacterium]
MDLDSIPWRKTRYTGMDVHFYSTDRDRGESGQGRVVALIRMQPGCGYPRHRHRGTEEVLVLRGGYRDEFGEHRAGAFVTYDGGTIHTPVAVDDCDEACVLLAIAREGIKLV